MKKTIVEIGKCREMAGYQLMPLLWTLLLVIAPTATQSSAQPSTKEADAGKTLVDYFLPMPIVGKLSKDVRGAPGVLPRDPQNGPYSVQGPPIYKDIKELPQEHLEDPAVWYSGGLYHVIVNSWKMRKAFHLTSEDGLTNWKFRGLAYDPTIDFIRYTDGTVNRWEKIERPAVFIENGHVTHFTFAVIDIPKEQNKGNDRHGSKVIVVPFDGAGMDRDLAEVVKREKAASHEAGAAGNETPVR